MPTKGGEGAAPASAFTISHIDECIRIEDLRALPGHGVSLHVTVPCFISNHMPVTSDSADLLQIEIGRSDSTNLSVLGKETCFRGAYGFCT